MISTTLRAFARNFKPVAIKPAKQSILRLNPLGIDDETVTPVVFQELKTDDEKVEFETSASDPEIALRPILKIMEQDDSRLFSKSENTLIAENFTTLLR